MVTETYTFEPHSFRKTKRLPWVVCSKCGLVALHNEFTEWGMRMGCNQKDHSQYESKRLKWTRL